MTEREVLQDIFLLKLSKEVDLSECPATNFSVLLGFRKAEGSNAAIKANNSLNPQSAINDLLQKFTYKHGKWESSARKLYERFQDGELEVPSRLLEKEMLTYGIVLAKATSGQTGQVPIISSPQESTSASEPVSAILPLSSFLPNIEPDHEGFYTKNSISPAASHQLCDSKTMYNTWEFSSKGIAYILNNYEFPGILTGSKIRSGSEVDVRNISHVFTELGYTLDVNLNLTKAGILKSLDDLVNRINSEGSKHGSVCLVLMSHGTGQGLCGTDHSADNERVVSLEEIKEKLSGRRCKALLGKPKLIFIQACRGYSFIRNAMETDATKSGDHGLDGPQVEAEMSLDINNLGPSPEMCRDTNDLEVDGAGDLPHNSDVFVANATSNGYFSMRDRQQGSWFIQALVEVFLANAHVDDLNELMRKVTCWVTEECKSKWKDETSNKHFEIRQTPAYESQGMRRRFFFFPKYPPHS